MALERESLEALHLAFGAHDQPERRVTTKVANVIEGTAACTDAMLALGIQLADRWNQSCELLDRVRAGVESLRLSADGHASAMDLARTMATKVMEVLGESADQAREGLEEQRPDMVKQLAALVAALAGRVTTVQDAADTALDEWATTLVGQQEELREVVSLAGEASSGLSEAMAAARAATTEGVTTLKGRLEAVAKATASQLEFADQQVIAPALNAWAGAVDDLPDAVAEKVTALLVELTPPVAEAGVQLAQEGMALLTSAGFVSSHATLAVDDLSEQRETIAAGEASLLVERTPLAELVTLCRMTAQELNVPW